MAVVIELTPALTCMTVIARTKDAVYVRLPAALQRDTGGCSCPTCKKDPSKAKWDTLVVPINGPDPRGFDFTHTVHLPDEFLPTFKEHAARPKSPF